MTEIKEKPIIVSSPFSSENMLSLVLFMVFLFVISIVCAVTGFASEQQIIPSALLASLGCFLGCIGIIIYMLTLKNVEVTETKLILKSGIGKELIFERKELRSFNEEHFKRRNNRGRREWDKLSLYTDQDQIVLSSEDYPEYKQLKDILTKELPSYRNRIKTN